MKKALCLCLIGYCFFTACHKNSNPAPVGKQKSLQIVVSNVTTTLTIFSFSVTRASTSDTLINIHSQTGNNAYAVNVNSGDVLKLHYFLELEGLVPPVDPHVSFICDGAVLYDVTNNAGIVSGDKAITIP
ncbi:MAG: hypothetical protein ACXVI9_11870 [Mucilaginibacter sp.]